MGFSVGRVLRSSLWDMTPRNHRQPERDFRKRQLVSLIVLLVGATVLGISLRIEAGSPWFYAGTVGLALVWTVGAFASGPLHLGRAGLEEEDATRPVWGPLLTQVRHVTAYADASLAVLAVTVVNGIAEELFFRGAVYAAIPRNPVVWSTVIYVIATLATGNVMLAFAAVIVGAVVGLQRRASGGILAPILTHVTWSVVMLYALPAIFL